MSPYNSQLVPLFAKDLYNTKFLVQVGENTEKQAILLKFFLSIVPLATEFTKLLLIHLKEDAFTPELAVRTTIILSTLQYSVDICPIVCLLMSKFSSRLDVLTALGKTSIDLDVPFMRDIENQIIDSFKEFQYLKEKLEITSNLLKYRDPDSTDLSLSIKCLLTKHFLVLPDNVKESSFDFPVTINLKGIALDFMFSYGGEFTEFGVLLEMLDHVQLKYMPDWILYAKKSLDYCPPSSVKQFLAGKIDAQNYCLVFVVSLFLNEEGGLDKSSSFFKNLLHSPYFPGFITIFDSFQQFVDIPHFCQLNYLLFIVLLENAESTSIKADSVLIWNLSEFPRFLFKLLLSLREHSSMMYEEKLIHLLVEKVCRRHEIFCEIYLETLYLVGAASKNSDYLSKPHSLSLYTSYFLQLLDYLELFTESQLEWFVKLLFVIDAYQREKLLIFIRKYICSENEELIKIAAVAGLALTMCLSQVESDSIFGSYVDSSFFGLSLDTRCDDQASCSQIIPVSKRSKLECDRDDDTDALAIINLIFSKCKSRSTMLLYFLERSIKYIDDKGLTLSEILLNFYEDEIASSLFEKFIKEVSSDNNIILKYSLDEFFEFYLDFDEEGPLNTCQNVDILYACCNLKIALLKKKPVLELGDFEYFLKCPLSVTVTANENNAVLDWLKYSMNILFDFLKESPKNTLKERLEERLDHIVEMTCSSSSSSTKIKYTSNTLEFLFDYCKIPENSHVSRSLCAC